MNTNKHNLPELLRIIAYPSMYRKDLEAAADLIEYLQSQLSESQARERAAVEDIERAEQLAEEAGITLNQIRSGSDMEYADYLQLFEAIADIIKWQFDEQWRGPVVEKGEVE